MEDAAELPQAASQLSEKDMNRIMSEARSAVIKTMISAIRYHLHDLEMEQNLPRARYNYNRQLQIGEIRLLKMQCSETELSFDLLEVPLDPEIKFTALSYTWGQVNPTCTIHCNGQEFEVSQNLYYALKELFVPDDLIWVDAICINQHDKQEKTHQVRMMKDIYSQANLTAVWLGQEQEGDAIGVQRMQEFYRAYFKDDLIFGTELDVTEKGFRDPEIRNSDWWPSVWSLFTRQWFQRVWVLQEVIASKKCTFNWGAVKLPAEVALGTALTAMKYRNLTFAWTHFERERLQIESPILYAKSMGYLWYRLKKEGPLDLQIILEITRKFQATDDLDKIFAMVGLSGNADPEFIDYGKDFGTVLMEIARNTLASPNGGERNFLSYVTRRSTKKAGVPSWVPALTYLEPEFNPLFSSFLDTHETPNSDLELFFGPGPTNALFLRGKLFDRIGALVHDPAPYIGSAMLTDTSATTEKTTIWLSNCEKLFCGDTDYPSGGSTRDAFWKSLIFDNVYPGERVTDGDLESYNAFRQLLEAYTENNEEEEEEEQERFSTTSPNLWIITAILGSLGVITLLSSLFLETFRLQALLFAILAGLSAIIMFYHLRTPLCNTQTRTYKLPQFSERTFDSITKLAIKSSRFEQAFIRYLTGRRFCVTERGYMGWVPEDSQPGDQICVFEGCRVLFAIRPQDDGFEILGDCYLHGLMDGGAMKVSWAEVELIKVV